MGCRDVWVLPEIELRVESLLVHETCRGVMQRWRRTLQRYRGCEELRQQTGCVSDEPTFI